LHGNQGHPFIGVVKYRDPKTGAEWTGHGRAPAWIKGVKDRTKFLIADSAGTAAVRHPSRTAAGKRAATKKSAAKGGAEKKSARRVRRGSRSEATAKATA
jgi:hypothetical protein